MKKIPILLLSSGLLLSLLSFEAFATCNISGQIVRVQNTDNNINPNNFIYIRGYTNGSSSGSGSLNYVYYGSTTDDSIAIAAGSALTSGTRTFITADQSTCPTSGNPRFMGNIRAIILNP